VAAAPPQAAARPATAAPVPVPLPPPPAPAVAKASPKPAPEAKPAPTREALAPALPRPTDLPRTALPPPGAPARRWSRPSVVVSGLGAALLAGLAVQQGLSSSGARDDANAMVGPGGTLLPGSDPAKHRDLLDRADARARNAWIAGGVSAALAVTTVYLGLRSPERAPDALAFRF